MMVSSDVLGTGMNLLLLESAAVAISESVLHVMHKHESKFESVTSFHLRRPRVSGSFAAIATARMRKL